MTSEELFNLFSMGVDFGQLLMEEERDSEDWADAFQGYIIDSIYSMPANIAPRRQSHSDEWRQAKKDSLYKAMEIIGLKKQEEAENSL